jgi:hypothetical protein
MVLMCNRRVSQIWSKAEAMTGNTALSVRSFLYGAPSEAQEDSRKWTLGRRSCRKAAACCGRSRRRGCWYTPLHMVCNHQVW